MRMLQNNLWLKNLFNIDWILFSAISLLSLSGLATMNSFSSDSFFFERQIIWLSISLIVFFLFSNINWSFLRRSVVVISIFLISCSLLLLVLLLGNVVKGSERWISFGFFNFQPFDLAKISLIILLAKYFSRRHIEIAHFKHIIVSGAYAFLLFILIFLQPNLSSSIVIFIIWFGMVMVSGISKKHVFAVLAVVSISFTFLWFGVLQGYQKQRIETFLHPLADTRGAGYNALQSVIAVGSGQWFGKGIGFGTQSRLRFLPEYQTDFIFAAFAEEWGFIGTIILIFLFTVVIWRIVRNALYGNSNFEMLFGVGVAIWFMTHFMVHVGMNIGLLPVTGITLPFLSYGGSHLLTESVAVGILMGMRKYNRTFHKEDKEERLLV